MVNDSLVSSTLVLFQPIVDYFSSLENVLLKFIDYSGEQVVTTQSRKHCSFCRYIQSNHHEREKCQNSARKIALMAKNNYKPIFTQCHAGLTLVAVPIRVKGKHFGSIGFGEIKENTNVELNLKRIASLSLDDKKLMSLYQDIPIWKHNHALNVAKTLYVVSNYFIEVGTEIAKGIENNQIKNTNSLVTDDNLIKTSCSEYLRNGSKSTSLSNVHEMVVNGKNFIISNYHKPIRLSDVAGFLHINSSYFSHLFKQITGYTFKNYLTQLRIEKAKDLLLSSSLTINQISQYVGYEDSNYFSRVFKKVTGRPPSYYKNNQ